MRAGRRTCTDPNVGNLGGPLVGGRESNVVGADVTPKFHLRWEITQVESPFLFHQVPLSPEWDRTNWPLMPFFLTFLSSRG